MAFERAPTIIPAKIGDTATTLFDPDPTSAGAQSASVDVQVVMSDGSVIIRTFQLADHFPAATITQLKNLVAAIRAKAVAEILPPA